MAFLILSQNSKNLSAIRKILAANRRILTVSEGIPLNEKRSLGTAKRIIAPGN